MLKKILLLILILSTGFSLCANAEIALNFNGFIADEANLLSEEVENDLNMTLWEGSVPSLILSAGKRHSPIPEIS